MQWTEKYRPKMLSELIISDDIFLKINEWIDSWKSGNPRKKSLLIFGPPGIGKTTTALCIANTLNVPVIEMNGSSQRNRDKIREIAGNAASTRDLMSFDAEKREMDKVILIDEADNMHEGRSGEDSGGIRELAYVIRTSRNPIIITMNEYYDFRRKQGADLVLSMSEIVEFKQYLRRNDNNAKNFRIRLFKRIRQILELENRNVRAEILNEIFDRDGIDIRAILNDVEAVSAQENALPSSERDQVTSIFKALENVLVLRDPDLSLQSIPDLDVTPDMFQLWIDNNLSSAAKDVEDLDESYDILSIADLYANLVIRKQHFAFLSYSQELAALIGSLITRSEKHFLKFQFPGYLGKMSSMKESRNARRFALNKLARYTHASDSTVSDQKWFFRELARTSGQVFEDIVMKLQLSDLEVQTLSGLEFRNLKK